MTGKSKFEDKEIIFRKELRRRLNIIKNKYSHQLLGGTWDGVVETIEKSSPYVKKHRRCKK